MGKPINEHIVNQIQQQHPDIFNKVFDGARKWQEIIVDPDTGEYAGLNDSRGGMLYTRYTGENDEKFLESENQYDSCSENYRIESEMRLVGFHHCNDEEAVKNSVVSSLIRMNWNGLEEIKPQIQIKEASTDTLKIWRGELPEDCDPRKDINLFKVDFVLMYEFDPLCESVTCNNCE